MGTGDQKPFTSGHVPDWKDLSDLLIYDGECKLCTSIKETLERQQIAVNVEFIPYQSEEAQHALGTEYQLGTPKIAYFVETQGAIHRGPEAFFPFLPKLYGGTFVLALWRIPPFRMLIRLVYRLIARYRYTWFGKV